MSTSRVMITKTVDKSLFFGDMSIYPDQLERLVSEILKYKITQVVAIRDRSNEDSFYPHRLDVAAMLQQEIDRRKERNFVCDQNAVRFNTFYAQSEYRFYLGREQNELIIENQQGQLHSVKIHFFSQQEIVEAVNAAEDKREIDENPFLRLAPLYENLFNDKATLFLQSNKLGNFHRALALAFINLKNHARGIDSDNATLNSKYGYAYEEFGFESLDSDPDRHDMLGSDPNRHDMRSLKKDYSLQFLHGLARQLHKVTKPKSLSVQIKQSESPQPLSMSGSSSPLVAQSLIRVRPLSMSAPTSAPPTAPPPQSLSSVEVKQEFSKQKFPKKPGFFERLGAGLAQQVAVLQETVMGRPFTPGTAEVVASDQAARVAKAQAEYRKANGR